MVEKDFAARMHLKLTKAQARSLPVHKELLCDPEVVFLFCFPLSSLSVCRRTAFPNCDGQEIAVRAPRESEGHVGEVHHHRRSLLFLYLPQYLVKGFLLNIMQPK